MAFPEWIQADSNSAAGRKFRQAFRRRYRRDPDYAAVLTYDATQLVLAAIEQAGPHRAGIHKALSQLSPWQGLGGPVVWDGTGRNVAPVIRIRTVRSTRASR